MVEKAFSAAGQTLDLGELSDGYAGVWAVQVVGNTGLTFTPQVSVNGTDWVTRKASPADGTADVTSLANNGVWFIDASACSLRLLSAGAGAARVIARPAIG